MIFGGRRRRRAIERQRLIARWREICDAERLAHGIPPLSDAEAREVTEYISLEGLRLAVRRVERDPNRRAGR